MSAVVIRETMRRHFRNLLYVSVSVLLVIAAWLVGLGDNPGMFWSSLVFLLAVAAGSELMGPEFSSGTLQLILVKPVSRTTYLLSRWAGTVLTIWTVAWGAFAVEALSRLVDGSSNLIGKAALAAFHVGIEALLVTALLALFGTFLRSYFNLGLWIVLQIAFVALFAVLDVLRRAKKGFWGWVGDFVTRHTIVRRSIAWAQENLFPDAPPAFDRGWVLLVLTNTAIALLLACLIFRKREVPYGAD